MWRRPSGAFVIAASVLGLALVLLTPPTAGVDESAHFFRAYEVSEFHWVPARSADRAGRASVPKQLFDDLARASFELRPGGDHTGFLHHLGDRAPGGPRSRVTIGGIAGYGPIGYVPSALAIGIGRLLSLSTLAMLYFARFANLAVYIALFSLAIRRCGATAWLFAASGLLPVGLFAAATVTTDAMTYALVALVVAMALRAATSSETWQRSDTTLAVAAALTLGLVKPPYALVSLLFVVAARSHRGPPRWWLASAGAASTLLMTGWSKWMERPLSTQSVLVAVRSDDRYFPYTHVDSARQLRHFVLGDPVGFARVLVRTTGRYGIDWLRDAPSQLSIPHLPNAIAIVCWLALLVGAIGTTRATTRRVAAWLLLFAAIVAGATLTGAYLSWNAVGSPYVRAYQGRYLYPLLLPVAIAATAARRPALGAALVRRCAYLSFAIAATATAWYAVVVARVFY